MKNLEFLGRLLFALPFAVFGFFHFMGASNMSGMVPSYFPAPVFWVYLTGVAHLLAAVAIIINKKARLAALLLGIMLFCFAFLLHFGGFLNQDPMASTNFLKDFALGGAAFFISSKMKN